jgi:pimeloyl-ACP methyl ester carboxylesterase
VAAAESAEYARLIANARAVVMRNTGHLGSVTHADEFAALVNRFVGEHTQAEPSERS